MLFIDKDGDLFIEDKDTCVRVYLHGDMEITIDDGNKDLLETYTINGITVNISNESMRKLFHVLYTIARNNPVELETALDSLHNHVLHGAKL